MSKTLVHVQIHFGDKTKNYIAPYDIADNDEDVLFTPYMFKDALGIWTLDDLEGFVVISIQYLWQPRTQGICSWGAKYPGLVWSRDPRILRKMASCLLGLGGEYILSQLNMINLIALII